MPLPPDEIDLFPTLPGARAAADPIPTRACYKSLERERHRGVIGDLGFRGKERLEERDLREILLGQGGGRDHRRKIQTITPRPQLCDIGIHRPAPAPVFNRRAEDQEKDNYPRCPKERLEP